MPPRLGNLKPRQVVRALERGGWYVHQTTGSHVQPKHPAKAGRVTVPCHQRFTIPAHIVKSIIRQAGLGNDEFLKLLAGD